MTDFPTSIYATDHRTDDVDDVMAADINELQDEINAIETALGTSLSNTILKSLITAKGGLVVGSASATVGQLAVGTDGYALTADQTQPLGMKWSAVGTAAQLADGRLTLTTATPVTTADVTAATSVFYTPFKGNRLALYDGASWNLFTFGELAVSLAGLTSDTNYDMFAFEDSGAVVVGLEPWSNATTRDTAISMVDGVYVNTAAMTPTVISTSDAPAEIDATLARYLGTIRTTATTGQCEDSYLNRFVWNAYHQTQRTLYVVETGTWTYSTTAYRPLNNSTANRVNFVQGLNENLLALSAWCSVYTAAAFVSIGLDSTDTSSAKLKGFGNYYIPSRAEYLDYPGIGFHFLQVLEYGNASAAFTGNPGTTPGAGALGYILG